MAQGRFYGRRSSALLLAIGLECKTIFAVARPSVVCLSVTLVRPTQAVQIFGNISTALGSLVIRWNPTENFTKIVAGEPPPPPGGVKHEG